MLLGTCVGFPGGVFYYGWRNYPWAVLPFALASIVLLHPVMEKDVPSLIGADMLREPRTYYGVATLLIGIVVLIFHFSK
jgi:hypothetical protein